MRTMRGSRAAARCGLRVFALLMAVCVLNQDVMCLPPPMRVLRADDAELPKLRSAGAEAGFDDNLDAATLDLSLQSMLSGGDLPDWVYGAIAAAQDEDLVPGRSLVETGGLLGLDPSSPSAAEFVAPAPAPEGAAASRRAKQVQHALHTICEWTPAFCGILEQWEDVLIDALITGIEPSKDDYPELHLAASKIAGTVESDSGAQYSTRAFQWSPECQFNLGQVAVNAFFLMGDIATDGYGVRLTPEKLGRVAKTTGSLIEMGDRSNGFKAAIVVFYKAQTSLEKGLIALGSVLTSTIQQVTSALATHLSWWDWLVFSVAMIAAIGSYFCGPCKLKTLFGTASHLASFAGWITNIVACVNSCSDEGEGSSTSTLAAGATFTLIGCVTDEALFGAERNYFGGDTAAKYMRATNLAATRGDKYFAVARSGQNGHGFTFDVRPEFPSADRISLVGCQSRCLDLDVPCGSSDFFNTNGNGRPATSRVWAVYYRDVYSFIGCASSEAVFGEQRSYFAEGARYYKAVSVASNSNHRYFAVARNGPGGFGFSFNPQPTMPWRKENMIGCQSTCVDDTDKFCGSGDFFTTGATRPLSGRVWAVYSKEYDMCTKNPDFRYSETASCKNDCECDGLRTCSLQGTCVGTARVRNWCGSKTTAFSTAEQKNETCTDSCDCDGLRTCVGQVCQGTARPSHPLCMQNHCMPAVGTEPPYIEAAFLVSGRTRQYCSDDPTGFVCNRAAVGAWEKFTIKIIGSSSIALVSGRTGKYCSDQSDKFRCDVDKMYAYETFEVAAYPASNEIAIKSGRTGKYCSDQNDKFRCDVDIVNAYERFIVPRTQE
jgi:hypothetical protein